MGTNLICESREDKTLKEEKLNLISLTQHPKYIDESDIKYYLKNTTKTPYSNKIYL